MFTPCHPLNRVQIMRVRDSYQVLNLVPGYLSIHLVGAIQPQGGRDVL